MKILINSLLVIALIAPINAYSNDGFVSFTPQGIVFSKTDGIQMQKEELTITREKIVVDYIFRNLTEQEIEAVIAFPMQDIECYSESWGGWYPHDFQTYVNGSFVDMGIETKAHDGERDITAFLEAMNIPIDCRQFPEFDGTYDNNPERGLSDEFVKAVELGIAFYENHGDFAVYSAKYVTKTKYFWSQTFPPNSSVNIRHEYVPSHGIYPLWYEPVKDETMHRYIDFYAQHFSGEWEGFDFRKSGYEYIEYILKTANTWSGPIEDFTLKLPYSEDVLAVADLPGQMHHEDGKLVLRKKNFTPERDLNIYYLFK